MTLPYMPLYVGDYLRDTTGLTTEQHGAYLLLLLAMWSSDDGTLPNDRPMLTRITGVHPPRWNRVWRAIGTYFTVEGDRITQKRLQAELQRVKAKSAIRSAVGKIGGQRSASNRYSRPPVLDAYKSAQKPFQNNDGGQAIGQPSRTREIKQEREASPSPLNEASASPEKDGFQWEPVTDPPKESPAPSPEAKAASLNRWEKLKPAGHKSRAERDREKWKH